MESIIEILKKAGVSVPQNAESEIVKAVNENYKTIAEFDRRKNQDQQRIKTLEDNVNTLSDKITSLSVDGKEVEDLRQKVADFEAAEAARKSKEEAEMQLTAMKKRFDPLSGERKFLNEGTENWIFEKFQAAVTEKNNAGRSDSDIFEEIVKDQNVFANPQQRNIVLPPASGSQNTNKAVLDELYGDNPFYQNKGV